MANNPAHIFLTGASSGIGLETARLLCERGHSVWGTSRDSKRLPTLPNFHPVVMELTDLLSIRENFSLALKSAGHFDVLINNSGSGYFGPLTAQTDEIVREQFQLLIHGPLELIRLALPQLRQRPAGRIINVTSLAGKFPVPYLGPYSAAKAAFSSLSESLRTELAQTNVRVIDLQPGDIQTNFHAATKRLDQNAPPADQPRINTAWNSIDHNMSVAPPARIVARAILRLVAHPNPPPIVCAGNFFQTRLAPFLCRLAPARLVEWTNRKYYRL